MKKGFLAFILILTISALLVNYTSYALETCQSDGLTTSVQKDFQMSYVDQDFIQIDNKELLKDLSQLKDLACLQYVDMTEWGVKGDVSNLDKLTNLVVFSMYNNPEVYGDICSLSGATKMRSLKFAFDTKVYGDVSCLKDINLDTFAMTNTKISGDLSGLSHMTNLKALYISGTDITGDISSLSVLTNLEQLGISDEFPGNSPITGDLSSLNGLTKLKKVSLYKMKVTNCDEFVKNHPNIAGGCSEVSQGSFGIPFGENPQDTNIADGPKSSQYADVKSLAGNFNYTILIVIAIGAIALIFVAKKYFFKKSSRK